MYKKSWTTFSDKTEQKHAQDTTKITDHMYIKIKHVSIDILTTQNASRCVFISNGHIHDTFVGVHCAKTNSEMSFG